MEASKNYTQLPPQPGHADPYRVTLCEDGTYRWINEYNMFKNPTILFTVYRVMFMSLAIVAILIYFFSIISGNAEWPPFKDFNWDNSKYGIIVMGFFLFVLPPIAYLIVAKIYGGKYMVLFEMDDNIEYAAKVDHLLKEAMDAFYMIRSLKLIRKKPSTSELIDWLRALMIGGIDPDRIAAEIPFAGVLLKKDEDLEELKKKLQ